MPHSEFCSNRPPSVVAYTLCATLLALCPLLAALCLPPSAFPLPNSFPPLGKLCHPWEIIAPEFQAGSDPDGRTLWRYTGNSQYTSEIFINI